MRATASLPLVLSATLAMAPVTAGYCDLWIRHAGSLGLELGACGSRPDLDHAYLVVRVPLWAVAAPLFVLSLLSFSTTSRTASER